MRSITEQKDLENEHSGERLDRLVDLNINIVEASPTRHSCFEALISMSTIQTLVDSGALIRIEVDLAAGEQPARLLYGTPGFIEWLGTLLAGAEPAQRLGEATVAEQVDSLFYAFTAGKQMIYTRQFRVIRAEPNAVWEFKTPDVRIFGWFLQRDCFAAVFGDWTNRVKDHDLYRGYRISIRRIRRELGVEDNLCVKGSSPDDVVSF
ncbi:hypothetical protein NML43_17980 [Rhodopseudomonas palustris]|uniref:hypothetical protein n=1 Tax=Rhodopseudomonas palustris TaxID=1076 RepID=UPI0020CF2C0B|nr:hypothetical protein [Rhodopseudomonas palustris]MCP9628988.1 hypothetical protein [Rhodopseudomonas palustris]